MISQYSKLIKHVIDYNKPSDVEVTEAEGGIKIYSYNGEDYIIYSQDYFDSIEVLVPFHKRNFNYNFILLYPDFKAKVADKATHKSNAQYVTEILSKAIILYHGEKTIDITLDSRGENYLEYENSDITAKIYNVKIVDLLKLYDADGDNLFVYNVRKGINSNKRENLLLKNSFFDAFVRGVVVGLDEDSAYQENADLKNEINQWITNKFGLRLTYEQIMYEFDNSDFVTSDSGTFWFKHNGITMFEIEEKGVEIERNFMKVNAEKVQIINGAQTLTRWYELQSIISDDTEEFKGLMEKIRPLIDRLMNNIKVKLSILKIDDKKKKDPDYKDVKERIVDEVTVGLNTQVPVTETDIFVKKSKKLKELNELLRRYGHRVAPRGEKFDDIYIINLRFFVQSHYVFIGEPGLARNLPREKAVDEGVIDQIKVELEDEEKAEHFSTFLKEQMNVNKWWKNKRKIDAEMSSKVQNTFYGPLMSNGVYLFKSYLVRKDYFDNLGDEKYDKDMLLNEYYEDFFEDFRKYVVPVVGSEISSNTFKNSDDQVFENLIKGIKPLSKHEENERLDVSILNAMNVEYIRYIKEKKVKRANYFFVKKFLSDNGISLKRYRTITMKNGSVTEAFPFHNSTFMEIAEKMNNEEEIIKYEESAFCMEVMSYFHLFIFGDNSIEYRCITFEQFNEEAQIVYDKTVEAFEFSDSSRFPRSSHNLAFHIRPKARDSSDVMEFSYGNYITKQTFWANKSTMNKLITERT